MEKTSNIRKADLEHDRKMIEKSFQVDHLLTEADMKKQFGKYGWGKEKLR
ncbi:hypothetical protein [Limosilactobacillus portuensis]